MNEDTINEGVERARKLSDKIVASDARQYKNLISTYRELGELVYTLTTEGGLTVANDMPDVCRRRASWANTIHLAERKGDLPMNVGTDEEPVWVEMGVIDAYERFTAVGERGVRDLWEFCRAWLGREKRPTVFDPSEYATNLLMRLQGKEIDAQLVAEMAEVFVRQARKAAKAAAAEADAA